MKMAYVMTGCLEKSGSQAPVSLLEIGQTCCGNIRAADADLTKAVTFSWTAKDPLSINHLDIKPCRDSEPPTLGILDNCSL